MVLLTIVDGKPDSSGRIKVNSRGMTAWNLRNYIKNKWGNVQFALMLDGGGSTQLAYYLNGQKNSCLTVDGDNKIRGVYTMIRTPWNW